MRSTARGGVRPTMRLMATLDALSMEAQAAIAVNPSVEVWRRAFLEILRLAYDARKQMHQLTGTKLPEGGLMGLAA